MKQSIRHLLQKAAAPLRRLHLPDALRLRREERWPTLCALIVAAALNGLLLYKYWVRLTPGGKLGFYSIFMKNFHVSGFDGTSCIAISCGDIYFSTLRHPLFYTLLLPFQWLDRWLMDLTGLNFAIIFMAVLQTLCATWSFVLLRRVLTDCVGLRQREALPLTVLFFSFAYVMLTIMVPDHFGLSLPLLLLTVWMAGRHMAAGTTFTPLQQALLLFMTAGVTVTNGVKTCLAALFTDRRRVFGWRSLLATALPLLLLWGIWQWQHTTVEVPQKQRIARMVEKKREKNPHFGERDAKRDKWRENQNGTAIDRDATLLKWSDISTSRLRSTVENLFGESLQLHRDHLLGDVQNDRPVFVSYRHPLQYAIGAAAALLLVAGVWCGRRSRLMLMLLSWLVFDATVHIGFGFGLNEVYIMTAHWAFVIPIAGGYLLRASGSKARLWLTSGVWALALWLAAYNATLIVGYCLNQA